MATIDEQLQKAEERVKQLKAQKQKVEAKKRAALAKQKRTEETRRKILAGALALDMMEKDESAKQRFLDKLDKFLTRDDDRALFGLPKLSDSGTGKETPNGNGERRQLDLSILERQTS